MKYEITVLRKKRGEALPYRETHIFETEQENATVATALREINASATDFSPIEWEHSCGQKKCGACAMRVNGHPRLACDSFLREFQDGKIELSPLQKFPVVADLIVDRSVLFENLRKLRVWLNDESVLAERDQDGAYDASRCLQCGCCLEICPNFSTTGNFAGMAGMVPSARLLTEMKKSQKKEFSKAYRAHVFEGCGKSLACRDICPAGLPIERLLSRSNAIAVWKRK